MDRQKRAYQALLVVYPVEYRRVYGEPMAQLFADRLRDEGGGPRTVLVWVQMLVDLVKSAFTERMETTMRSFRPHWWGMIRLLLVGGTVTAMVGTSAYFGLSQAWGGPLATASVSIVAAGLGLLSLDATGATKWTGIAAAVSGLTLAGAVAASAFEVGAAWPHWELLVTSSFLLFMATLALFGFVGLASGSLPLAAAIALAVGSPILAAGVWQEPFGDIGFLVTVAGLVLLGASSELPDRGPTTTRSWLRGPAEFG